MNIINPVNTGPQEFLGVYYPYYIAICGEAEKSIGHNLQDIFDSLVMKQPVAASELDAHINQIRERSGGSIGYSKAQNLVLRVLGYRSSGLAYELRKAYSMVNHLEELHYPNMWFEFLRVPLQDSVFGSPDYCQDAPSLHYVEFLFEPLLRGLIPYDEQLPTPLKDTFLTMLMISQQKTMSLPMARTMAKQIEQELSGFVLRHNTALNMVAFALGYKVWGALLAACEEDCIPNTRYKSRFAKAETNNDDWTDVASAKTKQFGFATPRDGSLTPH